MKAINLIVCRSCKKTIIQYLYNWLLPQYDRVYSIHKTWKALDSYPESNFRWVPQPNDEPLEYKPKRRRIRKRKRRPPISAQDDYSADEPHIERPLRRRLRPFRLQQTQEPWEELQNDPQIRPNIRRRVFPDFRLSSESIISKEPSFEFPSKNKMVFEHINEENLPIDELENETRESQNPVSDLKNLLKQSGGTLSLSEILQQKNLSLTELLNGNEKAISALTGKTVEVTERMTPNNVEQTTKDANYPSLMHKTTDRNLIQNKDSSEPVPSKATSVMQRKRLTALSGSKEKEIFPTVIKMDVITEATTERRIFVPSHPKYYTSIYYKPDLNSDNKQLTQNYLSMISTISTTTSTHTPKTTRPYIKQKLVVTNTKINISTKETGEQNYPVLVELPLPSKIDINKVTGIKQYKEQVITQKPIQTDNDQPMKVPIDIDIIMEKNIQEEYGIVPITEIPVENMTYINARDEIMEILKDPDRKEKLASILHLRNMTVEELVQQRERGSSQRHLADIFHNKNKEPEALGEPHVVSVEGQFDLKLHPNIFERQQKSQKLPATEIIKEIPKNENKEIKIPELPKLKEVPDKIEQPLKIDNKIEPFHWIGEIIPVLPKEDETDGAKELSQEIISTEDYYLGHNPRLEIIDNTVSLASSEELNVDEEHLSEQVFIKIPSGVKSAIFVSLAIIGLSMVVFLTIFMIFKWSQKQTRAINYCSSLSAKLRSPIILQGGPTTAIKTFVSETLGRKKNYYKSNVKRMCDDMWEGGAEKKLSF